MVGVVPVRVLVGQEEEVVVAVVDLMTAALAAVAAAQATSLESALG